MFCRRTRSASFTLFFAGGKVFEVGGVLTGEGFAEVATLLLIITMVFKAVFSLPMDTTDNSGIAVAFSCYCNDAKGVVGFRRAAIDSNCAINAPNRRLYGVFTSNGRTCYVRPNRALCSNGALARSNSAI